MATETYFVTYMMPVTIAVEVGAGPESARRAADTLINQLNNATVRMHVQGRSLESPIIVEAELGQAYVSVAAPTLADDE